MIHIMARSLLLAILLLSALPGAAAAADAVDQSMEVDEGSVTFYQPQNSSMFAAGVTGAAQTFTAGMSGALTRVELLLARAPWTVTDGIFVEIRAGDPTGPLLATSRVVAPSGFPTADVFAWTAFTFGAPANVVAGQAYAIVLPPGTPGDDPDPTYRWAGAFTDVYRNGVAWDRYPGDPTWHSYVFGSDRTFRTYVGSAPAEPAPFAGLWVSRDGDGSWQGLAVGRGPTPRLTLIDSFEGACGSRRSPRLWVAAGTAVIQGNELSAHFVRSGCGRLQTGAMDFCCWIYDPAHDTLFDGESTWHRVGRRP